MKCVNSNINVTGVDINPIPQDNFALGAANVGGGGAAAEGANTQNGNGLADRINFERNLVNICLNANLNVQVNISPTETTLKVTKFVNCEDNTNGAGSVSVQQRLDPCVALKALITEDQFNIKVTGNNLFPSSFDGSEAGTDVTLVPGNYVVQELDKGSVLRIKN
jgi:hypothetical protein